MSPTPVVKRQIGEAKFSAIGYGAMGLAVAYGPALPDEERLKVLDGVYKSGITHWDTADAYLDSEHLIGEWFKRTGKRNEIFLATKFGMGRLWQGDQARTVNGTPEWAVQALHRSLEQLGTDYVDLWYLHRADINVPIERAVYTRSFNRAGLRRKRGREYGTGVIWV
ncbi:NADP-dependent oxidoreductase domain-containing protein [Ganoderma leucocontextum]|nr:NADP-dependent oxidoreductase domain-containing protein [Ganoderma leucocontextum]